MADFTRFSAPLWIEYAHEESTLLGKDLFRVVKTFRFYVGNKDLGKWVEVPRGYLFDGASVPRIFWGIIPPWGRYGAAAAVHDILCEYLLLTFMGKPHKISRAEADRIFAEAMEVLDVPKDTRDKINLAVGTYREVMQITQPAWHKEKAALEAKWLAANPE